MNNLLKKGDANKSGQTIKHSRTRKPNGLKQLNDQIQDFEGSTSLQKRTRGATVCDKRWSSSERVSVEFNENGQPMLQTANDFMSFLGTVACNGRLLPLTCTDWRKVPRSAKENAWQLVLSKFDIEIWREEKVMLYIAANWRSFKGELKSIHYDLYNTDEERMLDRDDRVIEEQWRFLINFWNSSEGKA